VPCVPFVQAALPETITGLGQLVIVHWPNKRLLFKKNSVVKNKNNDVNLIPIN